MSDDFPGFQGPGKIGHLIDHVQSEVKKDHADVDVRRAMADVSAKENRERVADDLGREGVQATAAWFNRVGEVGGHQAAQEYGYLSQYQPRRELEKHERSDDSSYLAAARSAWHAESDKAKHAVDRPATLALIEDVERRYGGLQVFDNAKRFHEMYDKDPVDAAKRVGGEIDQGIKNAIADQQARKMVQEYRGKPAPETRERMRELLNAGVVKDLAEAQRESEYELALDVPDSIAGYTRAATSAVRTNERHERANAKAAVAEWEQLHPERVGTQRYERMKSLLQSERATDLDDAWAKAGGARR